jgi:uroporphyrinogen-III synthase
MVFMSPRGVSLLLEIFRSHSNLLPSVLGRFRIVAVGPRTREALLKEGIHDVSTPEAYSSEGVALFLSKFPLNDRRVVLARSSDADDSLARTLSSKGAVVKTITLYSSSIPEDRSSVDEFVGELKRARVHAVLFTSSASSSNLFRMTEPEIPADELAGLLGKTLIGAIGPSTARKLQELGVEPDIVPARHLIDESARLLVEISEARKAPTPTSSVS